MFEQVPQLHDGAEITETEYRQVANALMGGVWRPIAHTNSTAVSAFSFTDIPQDGRMLALIWSLDNDTGAGAANIFITVNDDAPGGDLGDYNIILGAATSVTSDEGFSAAAAYIGATAAGANPAGSGGTGFWICHGYSLPGFKTLVGCSTYHAGAGTRQIRHGTGTLATLTPLTELTLDADSGSFVSGGAVTLLIGGGTERGVTVGEPEEA